MFNSQCSILSRLRPSSVRIRIKHWEIEHWSFLCVFVVPNPSIRGVGVPMDGLSALPWTARWCQGTLPWPPWPQSVDKRCRRSHGRVERLAMDGPLVSRYLTLVARIDFIFYMAL